MPCNNMRGPRLRGRRWRALHPLDCKATNPEEQSAIDDKPDLSKTTRTPGLTDKAVRKQS